MPGLDPGIHQNKTFLQARWIGGSSRAMTERGNRMRLAFIGSLIVMMACSSLGHAADIAAGKEKAELCAGCHGDNGISQTENIPSLAGQPDQFIQWQLVFFRGGSRKNEQMQPIAEAIGNEDVRALGAYFASLTPPKPTTADDNPDLSKKGG